MTALRNTAKRVHQNMTAATGNIVIFGATGNTGHQLVEQALKRDMHVTAFARDPQKMQISHARLKIVQGDILDTASLDSALNPNIEAAVSALGVFTRKPSTELSVGTANIINALNKNAIRRFVVVSSLGVDDSRGQGNFAARAWQRFVIPKMLEDKERQEQAIRDSDLDWTVFRPCRLINEPESRQDLVEWSGPPPSVRVTWRISMASLANRILDVLDDPAYTRRAVSLSDPA
jgi:putative NADH-flavin reductase